MTSHAPSPLPPVVQYPSSNQRLTHAAAHSFLSSFLERAVLDPAFAPSSVLSERGPMVRDASGKGGLVGRGLEKVLKGMSGERVGRKIDEEEAEAEAEAEAEDEADAEVVGKGVEGEDVQGTGKKRKRHTTDPEEQEWERWEMDLSTAQVSDTGGEPVLRPTRTDATTAGADVPQGRDDYELMQDDENEIEVDAMNSARHRGGQAMLEEEDEVERFTGTQQKRTKVDKAERKRLKAERRKVEKMTARTS